MKFIQFMHIDLFSGLFNLKTKYDESDNVVVRASRVVTDKLQDVFSKLTELYCLSFCWISLIAGEIKFAH